MKNVQIKISQQSLDFPVLLFLTLPIRSSLFIYSLVPDKTVAPYLCIYSLVPDKTVAPYLYTPWSLTKLWLPIYILPGP